ncbi:8164_t:CDS:2 [Funneliformis mosseae]|uniref:8164_t:CDS:1 n=1 Tax=Funneliformis mosseae TaxID=27381 RepID=A0A9N9I5X5_FUNMO|nr:8164_t:CDS:2 [Funneliformis mosseae]
MRRLQPFRKYLRFLAIPLMKLLHNWKVIPPATNVTPVWNHITDKFLEALLGLEYNRIAWP